MRVKAYWMNRENHKGKGDRIAEGKDIALESAGG
jgi:hypothetical protein